VADRLGSPRESRGTAANVKQGTDQIVGATIVARHAGEQKDYADPSTPLQSRSWRSVSRVNVGELALMTRR
jgi:hypothetical protein